MDWKWIFLFLILQHHTTFEFKMRLNIGPNTQSKKKTGTPWAAAWGWNSSSKDPHDGTNGTEAHHWVCCKPTATRCPRHAQGGWQQPQPQPHEVQKESNVTNRVNFRIKQLRYFGLIPVTLYLPQKNAKLTPFQQCQLCASTPPPSQNK